MSLENEQAPVSPPLSETVPRPQTAAGGGLSLEDIILLNEEIAGMARAGLPLDQGLALLAREMGSGKLARVTDQIAFDLKSGCTLPQAIERQEGKLPAYYARLLGAGIRSGRFADVLSTMTVYAKTLTDMRNTVVAALLYPAVVLVFSLAVFTVLVLYLGPLFRQIFNDFKMQLPLLTQMVFFFVDYALIFFVVLPLSVVAAVLAIRWWMLRTEAGRVAWTRFWYVTPIVGTLLQSARLAAFTDLLGVLVDNGVPLTEAFVLAGESSSDPLVVGGTRRVQEGLRQGKPLASVLREQELVPEVVAWMISLGEKRGTLGDQLHQAGEMYRRQVEMRANLLRSVLPPILIILVAGVLVTLFFLAMFLPLQRLIGQLGGGF